MKTHRKTSGAVPRLIGGVTVFAVGASCVLTSLCATTHFSILSRVLLLLTGIVLVLLTWVHTGFCLGVIFAYLDTFYFRPHEALRWQKGTLWMLKHILNGQVRYHDMRNEIIPPGNEIIYNRDGKSPVIFVFNHLNRARPIDAFSLALLNQPNVRIVAAEKLRHTLAGKVLQKNQGIFVEHGGGLSAFLKQGQQALREGSSLIMFPEGKYSGLETGKRNMLRPFQMGAFLLAFQEQIPVVPVVIDGRCCLNGFIKPNRSTQPLTFHVLSPVLPNDYTSPSEMRSFVCSKMQQTLDQLF